MSELGLCSRREADEWIEKGWVLVDGERIDTLGTKVRADQRIEIDSNARAAQAAQVTILLHKPVGYVSGQAEDGYAPPRRSSRARTTGAATARRCASRRSTCARSRPRAGSTSIRRAFSC